MVERDTELHRFLHEEIGSEEALDVLVFLFRNREQWWSAGEVRDRLRIAGDATGAMSAIASKRVELRMTHLQQKQLLITNSESRTFRYKAEKKMTLMVETLAALNESELTDVARLIYLRPRGAAEAFAEAFAPRRPRS
ncbi:MAG TPA: hypothetical protein VF505_18335 [Thermoanaerobaculia bacterium]